MRRGSGSSGALGIGGFCFPPKVEQLAARQPSACEVPETSGRRTNTPLFLAAGALADYP